MSDATLDQVHASPELLSSGAAAADARAVSSTVLVNEGFPTPSHLSFAAATPSRSGLQQLGTIALLLYVAQLLTGEPDLTILPTLPNAKPSLPRSRPSAQHG